MSVIQNPYALKPKRRFASSGRDGGKKRCSFDRRRSADECAPLNVANSEVREINESEFSQLEKGKRRFMTWHHGAQSCSITRFTINPNKEETAPPVASGALLTRPFLSPRPPKPPQLSCCVQRRYTSGRVAPFASKYVMSHTQPI